MSTLVLTSLLALWAAGALVAVSLCVVAGRFDRAELARQRRFAPLRLVDDRWS